jgi:hypothetical protein
MVYREARGDSGKLPVLPKQDQVKPEGQGLNESKSEEHSNSNEGDHIKTEDLGRRQDPERKLPDTKI